MNRIILALLVVLAALPAIAQVYRIEIRDKETGEITNRWTTDQFPEDHKEPAFENSERFEVIKTDITKDIEDERIKRAEANALREKLKTEDFERPDIAKVTQILKDVRDVMAGDGLLDPLPEPE